MLTCEQLDAMSEIIDVCEGRVPPLTLLKGISICEQYYPEPHLRPMRDIDFLVEAGAHPTVESLLFKLGYHQESKSSPEVYERHHHNMPFFHPKRGIWVEVHRGLFPRKSKVGAEQLFSLDHFITQLRPSEFQGREINRLSDELQLVYIASHWAQNFQAIGGMVAMLDIIYLWNHASKKLNWGQILDWLPGSVASTHLYLLLGYLNRHRLIDISQEMLKQLFLRQRSFGKMNLHIIYSLIDRYLVDGENYGKVLSLRNCFLLWEALVAARSPLINLMLMPWRLILPYRLRKRFESYETSPIFDLKRLGRALFSLRTGSPLSDPFDGAPRPRSLAKSVTASLADKPLTISGQQ
jgi:hypothetical protein